MSPATPLSPSPPASLTPPGPISKPAPLSQTLGLVGNQDCGSPGPYRRALGCSWVAPWCSRGVLRTASSEVVQADSGGLLGLGQSGVSLMFIQELVFQVCWLSAERPRLGEVGPLGGGWLPLFPAYTLPSSGGCSLLGGEGCHILPSVPFHRPRERCSSLPWVRGLCPCPLLGLLYLPRGFPPSQQGAVEPAGPLKPDRRWFKSQF